MLIALRINFKSHIQHSTSKNVKLYFKKNCWPHPILFSPSSRSQEDYFGATKCCWLLFRNNEDISSNCLLQKLILSKLKFEGVHYFKNILHLQVVIIITVSVDFGFQQVVCNINDTWPQLIFLYSLCLTHI